MDVDAILGTSAKRTKGLDGQRRESTSITSQITSQVQPTLPITRAEDVLKHLQVLDASPQDMSDSHAGFVHHAHSIEPYKGIDISYVNQK